MIEILYSQKVRDMVKRVDDTLSNHKLLAQHTSRSKGKRKTRIRIEQSLTVTEIAQLKEYLISKYGSDGKWSEVSVTSTSWNKQWFKNVRGTEIVFTQKPEEISR